MNFVYNKLNYRINGVKVNFVLNIGFNLNKINGLIIIVLKTRQIEK